MRERVGARWDATLPYERTLSLKRSTYQPNISAASH
jgi:hypothetical protein